MLSKPLEVFYHSVKAHGPNHYKMDSYLYHFFNKLNSYFKGMKWEYTEKYNSIGLHYTPTLWDNWWVNDVARYKMKKEKCLLFLSGSSIWSPFRSCWRRMKSIHTLTIHQSMKTWTMQIKKFTKQENIQQ